MELIKQKANLILYPVDIEESCVKRIDQFCKLLRTKLSNNWIVDKSFLNDCDVQIKRFDGNSITNHSPTNPTIYLVYQEDNVDNKFTKLQNIWLLHYPIFSHALVSLLNEIDRSVKIQSKKQLNNNLSYDLKEKLSKFLRKPFKRNVDKKSTRTKKPVVSEKNQKQQVQKQEQTKSYVNSLVRYFKPDEKQKAKIVFLGRPGSGKTTAIVGVSKIKARTTEVSATDHVGLLKNKTTIGIDYGEFEHEKIVLKLYGTPGQQRYDYMRQLVIQNVDAYIVLIDLSSKNPMAEVAFFNNIIKLNSGTNSKVLYTFTHHDLRVHEPKDIVEQMKNSSFPSVTTIMDPRSKQSVRKVMNKIAVQLS